MGFSSFSFIITSLTKVVIIENHSIPLTQKLTQKYADPEGHFIIIIGHLQNQLTTLASVYAPNTSKQTFFRNFINKLSEISEGRVIVGGDFNTTLNTNVDRSQDILDKQKTTCSDRDTKHLIHHLKDEALVDVWREKHPLDRDYTYYSNVHATYSRIDFIFTKPTLLQYIHSAKIHYITWSDHDKEICVEITNALKEYFLNNTPTDTSLAIRWDAHKSVIRGILIKHASRIKRIKTEKIKRLSQKLHDIATAHKKKPPPDKYREIQDIRTLLIDTLSDKAAYAMCKTKYQYYEYSNKPHTMLAENREPFTPRMPYMQ
ncbi:hypothetical protein XELAEV_18040610mg [Xenopus laevis]|uniref:exodeoxyribonuclease III n=1 Tax=Xenopus laevis TaxID=8355 RepID=A0A974CAF2_XENLA|nr:hypothetical protein XELAEV_18040610mg [Xenopus laevis]